MRISDLRPCPLGKIIAKKSKRKAKMENIIKYIDFVADLILLGLVCLAHWRISKLEKSIKERA